MLPQVDMHQSTWPLRQLLLLVLMLPLLLLLLLAAPATGSGSVVTQASKIMCPRSTKTSRMTIPPSTVVIRRM